MCQAKMSENSQNNDQNRQNWQDEARRQYQMYPNLEELINQSGFLRDFFGRNETEPRPSAPPSAPPPNSQQQQQQQPNAGGWRMPNENIQTQSTENLVEELLRRFVEGRNTNGNTGNDGTQNNHPDGNRSNWSEAEFREAAEAMCTRFKHKMKKAMAVGLMLLLVLILPKFFLVFGIFAALMNSFGMSVMPVLLGGAVYELLTCMDPCLITLLAGYSLYKVVIKNRPLIDVGYWRGRCRRGHRGCE